jgi:osmotically-inducible protein OsmY
VLGCCFIGAGVGVVGCQNTAEGLKQDTAKNATAVENVADKAAVATKNAAENATEKTKETAANAGDKMMTPKVKTAIVANKTLNNPKNLINVNTDKGVVTLKGHVQSDDQKKLAGQIAEKTVKDAGSKDQVVNDLAVQPH